MSTHRINRVHVAILRRDVCRDLQSFLLPTVSSHAVVAGGVSLRNLTLRSYGKPSLPSLALVNRGPLAAHVESRKGPPQRPAEFGL